jgi:hypothetical protein
MRARPTRRSALLAIGTLLLAVAPVVADTVTADADVVAGVQNSVDLGVVAPGAIIERDVTFTLACAGLNHADPGQTVTLAVDSVTIPGAGGSISATSGAIGPVPANWASDVNGIDACPFEMSLDSSTPSHVTIVAPSTPGIDYGFTILYAKSLAPSGASDSRSLTGTTGVSFVLDVEADTPDTTPPALVGVPADVTAETTDPNGLSIVYALPTATDDMDPAPVVGCTPPSASIFAVGSTVVTCTATDASGNSTSDDFTVTVTYVEPPDTTPPQLSVPADVAVWTDDPAGLVVAYEVATAIDDRDPAPSVGCSPASGSLFPLGATTVTCTAADAAGNTASATFGVTVSLNPDATPPTLIGMSASLDLRTDDPAGMVVEYAEPTATDDRDPAPVVDCAPLSGLTFPIGSTTVTCTATDASGNTATGSFVVAVHLVTATFAEPVGDDGMTVKSGRPVHLRTQAFMDGVAQGGAGSFVITSCADGAVELVLSAEWLADSGRWTGTLDSGQLAVGCHRVALVVDGVEYGSFPLTIEPKGKPTG